MLTTLLLKSPVLRDNRDHWLPPSVYDPLQHGRSSGFTSVVNTDLAGSAMNIAAPITNLKPLRSASRLATHPSYEISVFAYRQPWERW